MKKSYDVIILGQRFSLKTDNDESRVKRVADYVNKVTHGLREKSPAISTQNVAILGALNIAEEMFAREERSKEMIAGWVEKLKGAVGENH